jgi:hypothetical protein
MARRGALGEKLGAPHPFVLTQGYALVANVY